MEDDSESMSEKTHLFSLVSKWLPIIVLLVQSFAAIVGIIAFGAIAIYKQNVTEKEIVSISARQDSQYQNILSKIEALNGVMFLEKQSISDLKSEISNIRREIDDIKKDHDKQYEK